MPRNTRTSNKGNSHAIILYLHPITVEAEVIGDQIEEKNSKIKFIKAELQHVPETAVEPLKTLALSL